MYNKKIEKMLKKSLVLIQEKHSGFEYQVEYQDDKSCYVVSYIAKDKETYHEIIRLMAKCSYQYDDDAPVFIDKNYNYENKQTEDMES